MSTTELKKLLVKRIQATDNEEILNALRVLTDERVPTGSGDVRKKMRKSSIIEKVQKKPQTLKPMTLKEFYARNAQSQKDIKEGRVFSQEEIKRRFGYKK